MEEEQVGVAGIEVEVLINPRWDTLGEEESKEEHFIRVAKSRGLRVGVEKGSGNFYYIRPKHKDKAYQKNVDYIVLRWNYNTGDYGPKDDGDKGQNSRAGRSLEERKRRREEEKKG